MSASILQALLNNTHSQLNLERISSLTNNIRIKSLEDLVIKLGYNPKYVKATKELVKRKDADIATLRKKLKLRITEDPRAKEVREMEK